MKDDSKPEEGKQYSLLELMKTGSWAESEVIDARSGDEMAETPKAVAELVSVSDIDRDKTNDRLEAESAYEVGQIWNTSWGYDQTNVEFFQVVRESDKSIWLRRITSTIRDGRVYPVKDSFCTDVHLAGNSGTRNYERDATRGYSEKVCRKTGYGTGSTYRVYARIDDVRTAYPYEGGGQYETYAAGGAGH